MTAALLQYTYLQILDLLTTVAFLLHGVQEGNPMVRLVLQTAPHPLVGLLAVKLLAMALGLICWRTGRDRLLERMNVFFAVVVTWNVFAIIAAGLRGAA